MNLRQVFNIGSGGFGIVDKVVNDDGVFFAKKKFEVSNPNAFSDDLLDNVKKRFIREAEIQSRLDHLNIVPIIQTYLENDPPYFIMKLAEKSLAFDIAQDKSLNGKYLEAILDILNGLEELHSLGIYHRDLKPANILRFKDSPDYYAIGDFGFIAVNQTKVSSLTQTGMRLGSDYYTAPEIVKDLRNASVQSDIYSVGCILHDMVGVDDRIPCGEIDEEGEYSGIFRNCTRKDPKRRFSDVKSLREAILSVGKVYSGPKTPESEIHFSKLQKGIENFSDRDINKLVTYIEDNQSNKDSIALLEIFNIQQIDYIINKFTDVGNRLAVVYAHWIRNNYFIFALCDELSIKLSKFVDFGNMATKADCLMAMLYLGTNHNRWFVEDMFVRYVGANMDVYLAKRLAIEFLNDGEKAKKAINHLKISVHFKEEQFHPLLQDAYNKL